MPRSRASSNALSLLIAVCAIACVGLVRTRLATAFAASAVKHDVYPLPSPEQTVVLSLGYRAALADYLFAHVLVSYGIHFQEKRRFEAVGNYLDAINELDPTFERPYRIADTLLTLQPHVVDANAYRHARAILERGMKQFPFDAALWSSAGQFMAYLGPGGLHDPAEQAEWQLAGGRALAHACELVTDDQTVPYHCIVAAGLLTRAGQQDAARQFLRRVTMTTEDPAIHQLAAAELARLGGDPEAANRRKRFEAAWGRDLPFVSMGAELIVGPSFQPATCSGLEATCATSWRAWGEHDRAARASISAE